GFVRPDRRRVGYPVLEPRHDGGERGRPAAIVEDDRGERHQSPRRIASRICFISWNCVAPSQFPTKVLPLTLMIGTWPSELAAGIETSGCGTGLTDAAPNDPEGGIGTAGEPGGTAGGCVLGIVAPP